MLSVPQESVPLPLIGIAIRAPHAVVCLILLYLCSGVTCEFAVARCRSIEGQLGAHGAIARALRSYPAIVQSPFFTRLIVMVLVPAGALHNTLWFLGISWLKATCFTVLCAIPLARAAWKAGFWAEPHADGEP